MAAGGDRPRDLWEMREGEVIDKEVMLAFINGPGSSLAFMFACLLLFFFGLYVVGVMNRVDRIKFEAKQEAQRSSIANVERTVAIMRQDNATLIKKLGGDPVKRVYSSDGSSETL